MAEIAARALMGVGAIDSGGFDPSSKTHVGISMRATSFSDVRIESIGGNIANVARF